MSSNRAAADEEAGILLNLFCTPERESWRVYVRATRPPPFLRQCFDGHGEAFPLPLDFEDLDDYMQKRQAVYITRNSNRGDVELTARGRAALELAQWLASAFASGVRGEVADAEVQVGRS